MNRRSWLVLLSGSLAACVAWLWPAGARRAEAGAEKVSDWRGMCVGRVVGAKIKRHDYGLVELCGDGMVPTGEVLRVFNPMRAELEPGWQVRWAVYRGHRTPMVEPWDWCS